MTGNNVERHALAENVQIVLEQDFHLKLSPDLEEEIDSIWQKQKAIYNLYDSHLFSLTSFTYQKIVGRFVPYRYYIASRQRADLQELLQIYPVGISGVSTCRDCVLVGLRDMKMSSYGGFLEFVPSGSIEPRAYMQGEVDFIAQAMWELAEEAKIGENKVTEAKVLGLFYSPQDRVYDIGLHLELNLLENELQSDATAEYPVLKWYTFTELEKKLSEPNVKIVPLSRFIWSLL
ncbi:MAG: hypothetical protein JSR37_05835 [Verrucomicrobia bacterium]|nr:hypothetical protein [Verrucomicrobiota bacterium]MBS0637444.1 hypothetical protein [Verrucomicrobiota bacterium]